MKEGDPCVCRNCGAITAAIVCVEVIVDPCPGLPATQENLCYSEILYLGSKCCSAAVYEIEDERTPMTDIKKLLEMIDDGGNQDIHKEIFAQVAALLLVKRKLIRIASVLAQCHYSHTAAMTTTGVFPFPFSPPPLFF